MRQRRSGTTAEELRGATLRVTAVRVVGEASCPTASDDHGLSADEAELIHRGLFHRPPFLSTVIRPVRKDSHVREP